ncbi:D-alanyl-D-alanine carboxypeptidase [Streptomyces sp. GC420]|uniref:D-alanyl-D-alanine carboxypeptidase n=1 Tax=Streptomyces sp. GC420 TaxID=2697568 RepID=UPI001414CF17|nr:DUF5136 domain-containing protein [Streptomyces sp. GC420]NBM18326.1 DUF5136 domain-containing protein [Streptomyces sp. GC420]
MTQLHTPKASRNQETGRLSFMHPVSPFSRRLPLRGGPSRRVRTAVVPVAPAPCTFSSVPASKTITKTVPKTAPKTASKKFATTALASALLTLLAVAPAHADGRDTDKDEDKAPRPPASMSTVGGALLGKPGTQVRPGADAPALPKKLTGRSWIVADAETGDVLAAHNAHWPLPPASTLKMLFADTLLPKFPATTTHKVTQDDLSGIGAGSSMVGVKENYTYSVHDLWLGVFLRSGNDAVHVLSAMNEGKAKTVAEMQAHAEELQAHDTKVVSPDGYDEKGQVSSAYDLTLFARSGMQKADFREYAATATAKFPGEKKKGKKRETFEIQNTNRLLTGDGLAGIEPYEGIAGVKNGYTSNAGYTFTGIAQRGERVLLVTVMNPDDKERGAVYKETARLFDWGFAAAGKVDPVGKLVGPKSEEAAQAGEQAEAGGAGNDGAGKPGEPERAAAAGAADAAGDGGGFGIALGVMGGVLVLVAAGVFFGNRRWPLRRPPAS